MAAPFAVMQTEIVQVAHASIEDAWEFIGTKNSTMTGGAVKQLITPIMFTATTREGIS